MKYIIYRIKVILSVFLKIMLKKPLIPPNPEIIFKLKPIKKANGYH